MQARPEHESGHAVLEDEGRVRELVERGAAVIAVSDVSGGVLDPEGLDIATMGAYAREHGSLEALLENALRIKRPALRTTLTSAADEIRSYLDIATLRDAKLDRPKDAPTDLAGGARSARRHGMNRLAERLEKQAASAT